MTMRLDGNMVLEFYKSTVGKKMVMAVTGLVLVGFVFGHMLGNLKMFMEIHEATGLYKIDEYAEFLRSFAAELMGHGAALWLARIVLLLSVVLHAASGISLSLQHKKAKPVVAHGVVYQSANAASRSMIYGGLFLVLFIVFHILHFTTGTLHFSGFEEGRVYANVWKSFQHISVVGFYVLAMAALSCHLYHGAWSMFQTLGATSPRWNPCIKNAAKVFAVFIFIGFSSVPVATLLGALNPPIKTVAHK